MVNKAMSCEPQASGWKVGVMGNQKSANCDYSQYGIGYWHGFSAMNGTSRIAAGFSRRAITHSFISRRLDSGIPTGMTDDYLQLKHLANQAMFY